MPMPEGSQVVVVRALPAYLGKTATVVREWDNQVAIEFADGTVDLWSKAALEVGG